MSCGRQVQSFGKTAWVKKWHCPSQCVFPQLNHTKSRMYLSTSTAGVRPGQSQTYNAKAGQYSVLVVWSSQFEETIPSNSLPTKILWNMISYPLPIPVSFLEGSFSTEVKAGCKTELRVDHLIERKRWGRIGWKEGRRFMISALRKLD